MASARGLSWGGGIGFAPTIKAEVDTPFGPYTQDETGGAANLYLGYAWDEFNMLVYEGNVAAFTINTYDISQGISAIAWYHYFGPSGKSFYTIAGLGFTYYDEEGSPDVDSKVGILIGGGYEFSKHWQFALYISSGKTELYGVDIDHTTVSMLIGGVAF